MFDLPGAKCVVIPALTVFSFEHPSMQARKFWLSQLRFRSQARGDRDYLGAKSRFPNVTLLSLQATFVDP